MREVWKSPLVNTLVRRASCLFILSGSLMTSARDFCCCCGSDDDMIRKFVKNLIKSNKFSKNLKQKRKASSTV